jgi:hypothetical protein
MGENEYLNPEHALTYLAKADGIAFRLEASQVLEL